MNVKSFGAMTADGNNLVMRDGNRFESYTAIGAWKRHCAVLSR